MTSRNYKINVLAFLAIFGTLGDFGAFVALLAPLAILAPLWQFWRHLQSFVTYEVQKSLARQLYCQNFLIFFNTLKKVM